MKFNIAVLALVLTAALGCTSTAYAQRRVDLRALHLEGVDGRPLSPGLDSHKAVLLNFWAPWCSPCREEIPWFQALQKSDPDITVIGIVADPDEYTKAAAFMKTQHVTYQLARLSPQVIRAFGAPEALPETFYLSSAGEIVHSVQGVAPREIVLQFVADAERGPHDRHSAARLSSFRSDPMHLTHNLVTRIHTSASDEKMCCGSKPG